MAVSHASTVLSWQENLSHDEMPPEWMWVFGDELEEWFSRIDSERRERMGLGERDADSMADNELTRGLRG